MPLAEMIAMDYIEGRREFKPRHTYTISPDITVLLPAFLLDSSGFDPSERGLL